MSLEHELARFSASWLAASQARNLECFSPILRTVGDTSQCIASSDVKSDAKSPSSASW